MRRYLTAALTLALLSATPAAALDDPQQLVRALYRLPSIPTKAKDLDRFFASDLAAAIKKDITGGEVGETNDGDYRYNAQDLAISGLTFTPGKSGGVDTVTVRFKNFGKPETVLYEMCLAKSGWKIANIQPGAWDIRQAVKLPASPVRC